MSYYLNLYPLLDGVAALGKDINLDLQPRLVIPQDYFLYAQIDYLHFLNDQAPISVQTREIPPHVCVRNGTEVHTRNKYGDPFKFAEAGDFTKIEIPLDGDYLSHATMLYLAQLPPHTPVLIDC